MLFDAESIWKHLTELQLTSLLQGTLWSLYYINISMILYLKLVLISVDEKCNLQIL